MAIHDDTTGADPRPAASEPITGDALILALAKEYRAAGIASVSFDAEVLGWPEAMSGPLGRHRDSHSFRQWGIETAIAGLKADGPAGAMVQLELLGNWVEGGETGDEYRDRKRRSLSEAMVWSIYGVLAGMTQHTAASGLNMMRPCRDVHRTNVEAFVAERRAKLAAEGIECVPRIPVKRENAEAAI